MVGGSARGCVLRAVPETLFDLVNPKELPCHGQAADNSSITDVKVENLPPNGQPPYGQLYFLTETGEGLIAGQLASLNYGSCQPAPASNDPTKPSVSVAAEK